MDRASQVTFRRNWKSRSKLYPIPYKDGLGPAVKNLSLTGEHAWIRKAHEKLYPCKLPVNSIRLRDNKPHPLFLHNSCTPQYLLTDCKQGLSQLPFPFLLPAPSFCPTWQHYCTRYLPSPNRPWKFPGFLCRTRTAIVCRLPEWIIILCILSSLQLPSSAALAHVSALSGHISPVYALSLQLGKTTVGRFLA